MAKNNKQIPLANAMANPHVTYTNNIIKTRAIIHIRSEQHTQQIPLWHPTNKVHVIALKRHELYIHAKQDVSLHILM